MSRALSCLVALLLVLQVAGLHRQAAGAAPPATAKAVALANLGLAIGQPVTLCEHGSSVPLPDGRDGSSGCDRCTFCHCVASGFAPAVAIACGLDRPAIRADVARSRGQIVGGRPRAFGSATPRGPPAVG